MRPRAAPCITKGEKLIATGKGEEESRMKARPIGLVRGGTRTDRFLQRNDFLYLEEEPFLSFALEGKEGKKIYIGRGHKVLSASFFRFQNTLGKPPTP